MSNTAADLNIGLTRLNTTRDTAHAAILASSLNARCFSPTLRAKCCHVPTNTKFIWQVNG